MPSAYVSPRFAAIDSAGKPLVGGRLYTYANTTTTPQTTYQNAAGTIANTNPIILDSRGEAVIFLQDGVTYTFVLKTATDALIWSQDSIIGETTASSGITVVTALPTSDIGPVYLAGQGTLYWNGSQYVSDFQGGFGNGQFSHRNKIINGDFRIADRGTSFTITSATTQPYTLNQWRANVAGTSSITVSQQTAGADFGPNRVGGFTCRIASNAAATPAVGDKNVFEQRIEGANLLAFALGSLWGGSFTIGFWAKASIVGTYSVAFLNGGSPGWRSYVTNYAVGAAGVWEFKTVTVPIDASGLANWNRTNGIGMRVVFDLGSGANAEGAVNTWSGSETTRTTGSVRLVGTNAATLEIGDVQLEFGTVPTPFETRPYSTEASLCSWYFEIFRASATFTQFVAMQAVTASSAQGGFYYSKKRAAPSLAAIGNFALTAANGGAIGVNGVTFSLITEFSAGIGVTVTSGLVAGNITVFQSTSIGTIITVSAEL